MGIVVYPGTFDPLTRGHEDLVRRASNLFGRVIVGVAQSRSKQPFFTLEERVTIAREALAEYPNVEVHGFDCLLMKFLHQHNAKIILRGLRAVSDFEYEFQMAQMNRHLDGNVETLFMMTGQNFFYLNSRLVKEVAKMGGSVKGLVPDNVLGLLYQKFGRTE